MSKTDIIRLNKDSWAKLTKVELEQERVRLKLEANDWLFCADCAINENDYYNELIPCRKAAKLCFKTAKAIKTYLKNNREVKDE